MFDGLFDTPERMDILSRVDRLRKKVTPHVYQPCYDQPEESSAILGDMPGLDKFNLDRAKMKHKAIDDGAAVLWSRFQWPILTREQERHLFRRMNFHKHRIIQRIEEAHPLATMRHLEHLERACVPDLDGIEADASLIASCNMRLLRRAVKMVTGGQDSNHVCLAHLLLAKCIGMFNYEKANKFSTYYVGSYRREAWKSEKRRKVPETVVDMTRGPMTQIPEATPEGHGQGFEFAEQANRLLEQLTPRDRDLIRMRYGIGGRAMTLAEVGLRLGVTKERARQLQAKSIGHLKNFAESLDFSLAIK